MSGETNLAALLAAMRPTLDDERWVFCLLPRGTAPDFVSEVVAAVHEEEGWTVVIPCARADLLGLGYEGVFRHVTLSVHSSLAAVGFLAAVATELAAADIACNAVSGVYHDHLFVPELRADDAMQVLAALSAAGRSGEAA